MLPTQQPRPFPTSSGKVVSLRDLASARAAPGVVATRKRGVPRRAEPTPMWCRSARTSRSMLVITPTNFPTDFRMCPQLDPHHSVDLCNSCRLHVEIIQKNEQPLPVLQLQSPSMPAVDPSCLAHHLLLGWCVSLHHRRDETMAANGRFAQKAAKLHWPLGDQTSPVWWRQEHPRPQ